MSITTTLEPASRTEPLHEAPGTANGRHNSEMDRLRHLILGETADRVEDISRQVTNRDARLRRLVEDMPEAIRKNAVDQSSLTRLAAALRAPIEEALGQSVRGDQQKVADILAPALARALPRTLLAFVLSIPGALLRRAWRVIWPWAGKSDDAGSTMPNLIGQSTAEQPFQVERVCLFDKESYDVLRTSDMGFDDEATALEVEHLFAQLAEALRTQSPSPAAALRYPPPRKRNEAQGMMVLTGDTTVLAAYHVGTPAPWLRDRMQDLASEVDALAKAALAESADRQAVEQRLQTLDALLKKGLVCYVPPPRPAARTGSARATSWFSDAAVVASVIGVVWVVSAVSRASSQWIQTVNELDKEPGIVVLERSWIPGRAIAGLRDPLAPDPEELLRARGYDTADIRLDFTPVASDEAPFKEQRASLQNAERDAVRREITSNYARALALMEASLELQTAPAPAEGTAPDPATSTRRDVVRKELLRAILELPADANFELKDGTLTLPASLPKATRSRVREMLKSIPWVKSVTEAEIPAKTTSATNDLLRWGTPGGRVAALGTP